MSEMETRRVRPGDPAVAARPGRVTIAVGQATGSAPDLEVLSSTPPVDARPMGRGRWSLQLEAGGSGEVGVRCTSGDVFPTGSALDIMVDLPGLRLNVFPRPDVSGLRAVPLVTWSPAAAASHDGEPRLLVRVHEAGGVGGPPRPGAVVATGTSAGTTEVAPNSGPVNGRSGANGPGVKGAGFEVEAFGPVAVRARNIARSLAGGARLDPGRRRSVVVVLDATTSMRTSAAGCRPSEVLAVVLGAAEVVGPGRPALHVARGPWVRQVDLPDADVLTWLPALHEPDAFGFTLEAARQALPPADGPRDVVVITDDVPPDLDVVTRHGGDTWRVVTLDEASAGAAVVPAPESYWTAAGELHELRLRQLVAAVLDHQEPR